MAINIARRKFVAALSGAAAAWPLSARAQQAEGLRRVGVLNGTGADDLSRAGGRRGVPAGAAEIGLDGRPQRALRHSLGRRQCRRRAQSTQWNWSRLRPTSSWPMAARLWGRCSRSTRTVPIVFAIVPDPVGAGFVQSLSRPGGNATGFMHVRIRFEREMAGTAQGDRAGGDASGDPS